MPAPTSIARYNWVAAPALSRMYIPRRNRLKTKSSPLLSTARHIDAMTPTTPANMQPTTPRAIAPQPSATPPPTPSASNAPVPSGRPAAAQPSPRKQARGSSFVPEEDIALTKAWGRISENAITGSDQKGEAFYRAIADLFDTLKPSYCTGRNVKSIERRVRKILSECLSFAACVARVTNAQPSGTNAEDVLHLATALFNKYEITSVEQSCGPPFKHLDCWHLLKEHPKFDLLLNPPDPEPPTPQTANDDDGEEESGYN